MAAAPPVLDQLIARFDPSAFDAPAGRARLRLSVDDAAWDFVVGRGKPRLEPADRNIYLDEPEGDAGFWTRLRAWEHESLFVWGKQDRLVPIAFARHVREALPGAQHLELECGHVPQLEAPRETHAAVRRFLRAG